MTDDLTQRVAVKLGWTHIHTNDLPGNNIQWMGIPPEAKSARIELPPWRTSVDAALSVLDKEIPVRIFWLANRQEWSMNYGLTDLSIINESLPRAILEAWLEVGG